MLPRTNRLMYRMEFAPFLSRYDHNYPYNTYRYDLGSVNIKDPSENYKYHWRTYLVNDDKSICVERLDDPENTKTILLTSDEKIIYFDFTFDQLMNPAFIYQKASSQKILNWYDTTKQAQVDMDLPDEMKSPRLSLDDKRKLTVGLSDIIIGYIKDNKLCIRIQRDRYANEYVCMIDDSLRDKELYKIGMSTSMRLLFDIRPKIT